MSSRTLTIALISEVFYEADGRDRLHARLTQAKERGAELAVLPEIPLNPWSPATKTVRDDDAEDPEGPRHRMQSEAARDIGIGLLGGAIVKDPKTGRRHNTALVFNPAGDLISTFRKIHVPDEPGFWECDHYDPGEEVSRPIEGFPMTFGVQICSDINRPQGSHLLGALGAHAVICPRSTELCTYHRWRTVFQANAITSSLFVLSVNRPNPEQGVLIGGPSICVAPNGTIMLETVEPVGVVTIDVSSLAQAKKDYPGYLPVPADLYARAWSEVPR